MPNLVELLRRLADEYESAEKGETQAQYEERIAALEARNPERFADAFKDLSAEDKAEIAEALGFSPKTEEKPKPPPSPAPPPAKDPPADPEPARARTRLGRKKHGLYSYRTDENGRVYETAVPTVYTGEDEPDEVELPAEDEPEGESAAA